MDASIMPAQLLRVKPLIHRAEVTVKDNKWVVTGGDPGDLEKMVNDWITKEKCEVKATSAPSVSVYAAGQSAELRIVFTTVTITYLAAVEQHNDTTFGRQGGELGFAPPGTDPNNTVISANPTAGGVSSSGNGVRGTSAFPNIGRE